MIIFQIILILTWLALTPLIMVLFTIFSNHIYYKLGCLLFFWPVFMRFYWAVVGNAISGVWLFGILLIFHIIRYKRFTEYLKNKTRQRFVMGEITYKKISMDFVISLWPLYVIKYLPFPIFVKSKKHDLKVSVRDIVKESLALGKRANVDVNTKSLILKMVII